MKKFVIRRVRLGLILLAVLAGVYLIQQVLPRQTAQVFVRMPEQVLIIDPGHGGEDGGAVSVSGQKESDINLAIALQLDQLMGFYGVQAVLTREDDRSIHDPSAETIREKKVSDLHNRVAMVNQVEGGTLISIHQNSYPSPQYHGTQVFYAEEIQSRPLAQGIQELVRKHLDPTNQRESHRIPNSVYLMNHVSCRAVLVECGFLSNPEEDVLLREESYQRKLAMVLGAGYLQYGDTQEGESLI